MPQIRYTREMFLEALDRYAEAMPMQGREEFRRLAIERFDKGHKHYGQLYLDDGRNWHKEAMEEDVDGFLYRTFDWELTRLGRHQ